MITVGLAVLQDGHFIPGCRDYKFWINRRRVSRAFVITDAIPSGGPKDQPTSVIASPKILRTSAVRLLIQKTHLTVKA